MRVAEIPKIPIKISGAPVAGRVLIPVLGRTCPLAEGLAEGEGETITIGGSDLCWLFKL